jgi:hypothetical protein
MGVAGTVPSMEPLGHGLIVLYNGVAAALGTVVSPVVGAGLVVAAAFVWMARLEIDEMNRRATKPQVGLH